MAALDRVTPTPGDVCAQQERIAPRPGFKPTLLHTRMLPEGSIVKSTEAEYCPVCFGKKLRERMVDGRPVWHCDECGNEW